MHNSNNRVFGPFYGPSTDKGGAKGSEVAAAVNTAAGSAPVAITATDKAHKVTMPTAVFALVANPKAYEDRNDKSKSNMRIAHVEMTSGPFVCTGSIYMEIKLTQTSEGRSEDKAIRFSLPKGVLFSATVPDTDIAAFKDRVIDEYLAWRISNGGNVIGIRPQAGYRKLVEAAGPAPAPATV